MKGEAAPVSPGRGRLLVAAAALLWSTGGLAIKLVPLPALGVVFWRSFVSAIFLQYTGPLYVLALAPFLLKERFRKADAFAVGVALLGMSLFFVAETKLRIMSA